MAGRSDAITDHVTLASAPSVASITICAWAKVMSSASPLFRQVTRIEAAGGSALIFGFKGANGRTPSIYSGSSTTGIVGTEVAQGTWVFVACTRSGTAAQLFQGTTPGSLTKLTGTVNSTGTPDALAVFGRNDATVEWLDGSLAYVRIWTSVLSDAQIAAESQSTTPVVTSGLWASWPFAAAALTDASGNGRTLTAGTTALTADTDPVLSTGNARSTGRVTETDTTGAVTRARGRGLAAVVETDATAPLTRSRSSSLAVVHELDTVSPLSRAHSRAVASVGETDTPAAFVRSRGSQLGSVSETDGFRAVPRGVVRSTGRVTETDSLRVLTRSRATALPSVAETDTPAALLRARRRSLAAVHELEGLRAVAHSGAGHHLLGRVHEVDGLRAVAHGGTPPPSGRPLRFGRPTTTELLGYGRAADEHVLLWGRPA